MFNVDLLIVVYVFFHSILFYFTVRFQFGFVCPIVCVCSLKTLALVTMNSDNRTNKMDWDVRRRRQRQHEREKRSNKLLNEIQITDKNERIEKLKKGSGARQSARRQGSSGTRKVWNATWIRNNHWYSVKLNCSLETPMCVIYERWVSVGVCSRARSRVCRPPLVNRSEIIEIEVIHCNCRSIVTPHTETHSNLFFSSRVWIFVRVFGFLSLFSLSFFLRCLFRRLTQ